MTVLHDLPMRDATPDDLPAIGALREAVGWGVNEWALRLDTEYQERLGDQPTHYDPIRPTPEAVPRFRFGRG